MELGAAGGNREQRWPTAPSTRLRRRRDERPQRHHHQQRATSVGLFWLSEARNNESLAITVAHPSHVDAAAQQRYGLVSVPTGSGLNPHPRRFASAAESQLGEHPPLLGRAGSCPRLDTQNMGTSCGWGSGRPGDDRRRYSTRATAHRHSLRDLALYRCNSPERADRSHGSLCFDPDLRVAG